MNPLPAKSITQAFPLLFLLLIITAAFFPLFIGRFYAIGDIREVYITLEYFFHNQILAGHLPAWLADAAWGFPVIASAQIGFFYPPLLLLRYLPPAIYLSFLLLIHFLWFALGAYLFYRRFVSSAAAALGALSLSLGGFVTLHLTHLNIIFSLAWLPWQFLVIYLLRRSLSTRSVLSLSVLLALPFLVGQIQVPLLMFLAASAWLLYLRHRHQLLWRRSLLILAALVILMIFISAVQLLPTYELMQQSTRDLSSTSFDLTRANQHSFPLYHLPTVLFPRFFANDNLYWGRRLQIEYGLYFGTFPLLAAFVCLFRRRFHQAVYADPLPRVVPFFAVLLILSFLFALGSLSPFRLIKIEPSLWVFSAPARWLLLTSFSLSFFSAVGADRFFRDPAPWLPLIRRCVIALYGFVLLSQFALWLLIKTVPAWLYPGLSVTHQDKIASLLNSAFHSGLSLLSPYTYLPLLVILIFALRFVLRHPARWALSLTALELFILFITTTPTVPWRDITSPPASLAALPEVIRTGQARLYSIRDGGDTGAYFTDPSSRANAAIRQQQRELLIPLIHTQFNLAGIEWPASLDLSNHSAIFSHLRANDSYQLTNAVLSKELNIGAVLTYSGQSAQIEALDFSPRLEIISPQNISSPLPYPYSPDGSFSIDLHVTEPSRLVVRDSFYPGWRATIDEKPTPITAYRDIFRQIALPVGRHHVSFSYRPVYLYAGIIISALTASLILIYVLITYTHDRRSINLTDNL